MDTSSALPGVLFAPGAAEGRSLSVVLPPGRLVTPTGAGRPVYWLSDAVPPRSLWPSLRAAHASSGLWPLVLTGLYSDPDRPWIDGECDLPGSFSSPAAHDAAQLLAIWWDSDYADEYPEVVEPYGASWQGLADPGTARDTPEAFADDLAQEIVTDPDQVRLNLRLGLVAADCGADALTGIGWTGPINQTNDTAEISAVVRSWEQRFGARVVGLGFDTLDLSVAAPPATTAQALRLAAEHAAFCPDNVENLRDYAELLLVATRWSFWWD